MEFSVNCQFIIIVISYLAGLCRLSGVPDLPEVWTIIGFESSVTFSISHFMQARGKMCAAYDPSGAIIVCGGGPRFWRPSNNCWQLVKVTKHF